MEFNVRYDRSSIKPRVIKTVYELNEVNEYIAKGHTVIFERIKLNNSLYSSGYIYQNLSDNRCVFAPSRRFPVQYSGWKDLPEDEWLEIVPTKDYARERSLTHDWAVYVLPLTPDVGEIFYIEDLIEDILVSEFWGSKIYAVDGIATWNGTSLELHRELYDSSESMIVG